MQAGEATAGARAGRVETRPARWRPRLRRRRRRALRLAVAAGLALGGVARAEAAELEIRWRVPVGGPAPAGFSLERRAPGETGFAELVRLPAGARQHLDADLEPGGSYCYRVRGLGGAAPTPASAETCGVASEPGTPVAAPPPVVDVPGPSSEGDPRHRPDRTRAPGGWIQQVEPGSGAGGDQGKTR